MAARDAAQEFRAFALRNGMLERERGAIPEPEIERRLAGPQLRAASDILQHRRINFTRIRRMRM
jgi:hypothetical protein